MRRLAADLRRLFFELRRVTEDLRRPLAELRRLFLQLRRPSVELRRAKTLFFAKTDRFRRIFRLVAGQKEPICGAWVSDPQRLRQPGSFRELLKPLAMRTCCG
ncbi:MAG: hypothetical protein NTZ16_07630, partial [Verrucomicrobia bacterium]|nr:hypothetical protein [Verrucomicrobiota bacterium]